jgi:hypothetical protein
MEKYLTIKSLELRKTLCRFRISAHDLRIEIRYEHVKNINGKNIPLERNKRICEFCNLNCFEDESHFITECPFYSIERGVFFKEVCKLNITRTLHLSNSDKFLRYEDIEIIVKLCEYLVKTFKKKKK